MNHVFKKTLLALSIAGLVACGGGGGGGSTPAPKPTPTPTPTPTTPTLSVSNASIIEGDAGNSTVEVVVKLSKSSTSDITVDYATANGTATAGEDYIATSGSIKFAAGETSKKVAIQVVGDIEYADNDGDETFKLNLSNAAGADITTGSATVTINNDDMTKREAYDQLRDLYIKVHGEQAAAAVAGYWPGSRVLELDLNADGDLDVLMLGRKDADHTIKANINQEIALFRNNLGKGFVVESTGIDGFLRDFEVADFNGDGLDDVMLLDHGYDYDPFPGAQDQLLIQNANGNLVDVTIDSMPQILDFSHGSCAGDFDNNGFQDVFVVPQFKALMNNNGEFLDNTSISNREVIDWKYNVLLGNTVTQEMAKAAFWNCETADVDNDGDIDILLGSSLAIADDTLGRSIANNHIILFNNGDGVFVYDYAKSLTPSYRPNGEAGLYDIKSFDYNMDGCSDFIVSQVEDSSRDFYVTIHKGYCDGSFEIVENFYSPQNEFNFSTDIINSPDGLVIFTYDIAALNNLTTKIIFNGDSISYETDYALTDDEELLITPARVFNLYRK